MDPVKTEPVKTMKVRMLSSRAGVSTLYKRGESYEFPEHQAKRMIEYGDAEDASQPSSITPMSQDEIDAANAPRGGRKLAGAAK